MFADRTLQEIHIPRPAAPRQLSLFGAAGREPARPALYGSLRRPVVPQETALFDFVLVDLEEGSLAALGKEEGWRLVLSLEGSAVCQAGSQTISLQAGDGILQRADRSLVCRPREGGWQALILRFDESALALTDRKLKKTRPNPFRVASPSRFEAAAAALLDACQVRAGRRSVAVREALQSLCSLALDQDETLPQAVAQVQAYILDHLTQDLTAADLVRASGISQRHLIRLFDEYTGLSPMNWLTQARLDRAMALLSTDLTIAQVAAAAGFPSEKAFRTDFRDRWKCSPSQYREAMDRLTRPGEEN